MRKIVSSLLVCLLVGSYPSSAAAQLDARARQECAARIGQWMQDTKLTSHFEILRVRTSPLADSAEELARTRLELRWRSPSNDPGTAGAEFAAFLPVFEAQTGVSLYEKLFFKFVSTCLLPSHRAAVHVHVATTDVATTMARAGSLQTIDSVLRSVMESTSVRVPTQKYLGTPLSAPALLSVTGTGAIASRLMDSVEQYYGKRGRFRRLELDQDYVRFAVEDLRDEIVRGERLWERVEGNLQISARSSEIKLRLHLDGQFAAGGASRPPDAAGFRDMEPAHGKQIQTYTAELLEKLRSRIMESTQ